MCDVRVSLWNEWMSKSLMKVSEFFACGLVDTDFLFLFPVCIYGGYILPKNIQRPEKSIIFGKVMLQNEYSYNHRLFHYEIVVWSLLNATYLGSVTQFVMEPFCLNLCLLMGVCISITKIVNVYTSYDFLFQILFFTLKNASFETVDESNRLTTD